MTDISPGIAFLAGFLSFLSPCVLPLVPGYLSLMSGVSVEKLKEGGGGATRAVALNAVIFILGFSVVFVAMGASASAVGNFLNAYRSVLYKFAGAIIILFGVFLLGLLKVPTLYRDVRYHGPVGAGRAAGSFLLGLAFAFGWTPCIGPILAGVLLLAATKQTVGEGVALLAIYSLGLGLPFFLTAMALNQFLSFYQGFRRYLQWVERAAGVLLIGVGLLVATNQLTWLASYFAFFNRFNIEIPLAEAVAKAPAKQEAGERPAAPDVVLERADGSTFHLSELRGKVVVLNFWATWCLPCRLEIPHFNKTYQKYRQRGVEFIGISLDEGGWPDIEKFLKEMPIEYTVALDKNKAASEAFGPLFGLPVTIYLDRQGRIAYQSIGITDVDILRESIEDLL
ncbi:MAG: cytochrome c biogenesis protein CcdA [Candidatus Acidiferrales bacterium]